MKRIACLLVTLFIGAACFAQTASTETAQNSGFPRVVARLNLFNRTKAIGPQTLYTPTKSGVFRISGTMVCTVPTGSTNTSEWGTSITFVNEIGLNNLGITGVEASKVTTQTSSPLVFNVFQGNPITLSIAPEDDPSGSQYNAYFILEQLE